MSPLGLILIIILIVVLAGGVGGPYLGAPWQPGYGWGHSANGLIVFVLIVVVILWAMGRM
jgi:hypothetical protein